MQFRLYPAQVSGPYPAQVTGIEVGQKCRRLHFLHAAIEDGGVTNGALVGRYVMHLEYGPEHEMPIVQGRDVGDWWEQPGETNTSFSVAWTGTNEESRRAGTKIRLFKSTWVNPQPDLVVRSIDFHALHPNASPFLVAVTVE